MGNIINFISTIEPDGLPYLWVNGLSFQWNNDHWELEHLSLPDGTKVEC